MHCVTNIHEDLYWLGGSDRQLAKFENVFPIPRGVSYNAYLVLDEKTVLLDTVDKAVGERFFENLEFALAGRPLDYVVVNHMEPDHCATLGELLRRWPGAQVVANAKTVPMVSQFFDCDISNRAVVVKEGDTLCTGRHTFTFLMAPMVHWPEVMVTYDAADKVLFSADAFGTFGALNGNIFADQVDFERDWLDDARRYYTNIVGKYGAQVQSLLKRAAGMEIQMICPLHGPIWRENLEWFLEKYQRWSTYTPEDRGVAIFCGSIYGHTENAAEILAARLAERGVKNIALYDVSHTDVSFLVSEAFRCSHLVLAAPTYNNGVYPAMLGLLHDMKALNLQNRTFALIENGSWASTAGKVIAGMLEKSKNITMLEKPVKIMSSLSEENLKELDEMAEELMK